MSSHRLFFRLAIRNLHIHWLRSLLAAIGIIIGVIAISSMGILGNSLVLSVSDSLTDVGDSVVVTPHISFHGMTGSGTDKRITDRQLEQIRRASGNNEVVPVYSGGDRIRIGREIHIFSIYGINPQDIPTLMKIETGQFLRGASGVMIGAKLASENNLAVGSRILVGDEEAGVRIVGILAERGMGFDISPDYAIITSDQWYRDFYDVRGYDQVIVKVRNLKDIDQIKNSIDAQLNRRETEVNVYDTKAVLESILETFGKITTFTMAIGGISLIVAGVSIFNVMMMSVMERYREIGILRSIGTKKAEVRSMFIYESLILGFSGSITGGFLSFIGGYAAIAVILQETSYFFAFSSLIQIPYGMAFGIVTSILSGLYPAWKASELRPIDALRHE